MPPRSQPTARQERLGLELRRLRENAGMTARESARLLETTPIQMSQMESGKAGISECRLRQLAAHYGCYDEALLDALVRIATDRTRGWWEDYRSALPAPFLDLAELEHHAAYLRIISVIHVPGLIQTEDYARAVFSFMVPELPPAELETRLEHRMRRKEVLTRNEPSYEAVVHEAALRINVADRAVSREQIKAMLDLADHPNIVLRVIPFNAEGFAGANCSMLHAGAALPQLDTFQRDTAHGSAFSTSEPELARLRQLFHKVRGMALDQQSSRKFIHRVWQES